MYNILIFDDRPQVRSFFYEEFSIYKDINIYLCKSIYEADDLWEENHKDINTIILDMMMPSQGLRNGLSTLTKGGVLTGWIWLWRHLNPNQYTNHPANGKCIIIYSSYLEDFKVYINGQETNNEEKEFAKKVVCINKNEDDEKIMDYILHDYLSKNNKI